MKSRSLLFAFSSPLLACGAVAPNDISDAQVAETSVPDSGAEDAPITPDASAPLAPMESPRSLFGTVTGTDGRVRVFSGLSSLGLVSSVESYDTTANTWTKGKLGTIQRYAHAVAQDGSGNVFVIGGTSNGKTPIANVEVFSSQNNTWSTAPDLPTARLGLAAATAKDGRIFAIGGGVPGQPTDVVEIYSPSSQSWSAGPSMPTARLSLQAVAGTDGLLYAIGGRDANTTPLTVVEALDPVAGKWTTVAPLSTARYWFAAAAAQDGRIFAVGGIGLDGSFTDSVEAFSAGKWSSVASLPEGRAWLGAAMTPAGSLLAIGGAKMTGAGQPPPLASMFSYDPATNHWSE